jgi:hypothetical protein
MSKYQEMGNLLGVWEDDPRSVEGASALGPDVLRKHPSFVIARKESETSREQVSQASLTVEVEHPMTEGTPYTM